MTRLHGFEYRIPEKVRRVIFSGEVMPVKHLNLWMEALPNAEFVNVYGPTEITCNCTYYIVDRHFENDESLPIGKPFPNERVFLLNEENALITEPGVEGELCVAGTALALGYYRNPGATAAAFTQNPLNEAYPELIYRTGGPSDQAYGTPHRARRNRAGHERRAGDRRRVLPLYEK